MYFHLVENRGGDKTQLMLALCTLLPPHFMGTVSLLFALSCFPFTMVTLEVLTGSQ